MGHAIVSKVLAYNLIVTTLRDSIERAKRDECTADIFR